MRPQPLVDHLRELLLDRIISGDLEAGCSLSQPALTEELEVSRTPLREALQRLAGEGFIDTRPDRGFFVPPLDPREGRELYEAVALLEALAFERQPEITEEDVRALRSITEKRREAIDRPRRSLELDREWHDRLLSGVENQVIRRRLADLKQRLLRYELTYQHSVGRVEVALEQHREIERALAEGREGDVPALLREHWEHGKELLTGPGEDEEGPP